MPTLTLNQGPVKQEFAIKSMAELNDNELHVIASSMGNMDRTGDVIAHGAFSKAVLTQCVDEGWMDSSHGWHDQIGYHKDIKVVGDELHFISVFHTTQKAQDARTVCKERLAANKKVSCSIGFMPDYDDVLMFDSGSAMVKYLEENGGTDGYDVKAIKAYTKFCRLIGSVKELYENSLVNIGANPRAKAIEAKQFDGDEGARGLPLSDRITRTLGSVGDLADDLEDVVEKRAANGRTISPSHEPALKQLIERLTAIHAKSFQPDEPAANKELEDIRLEALRLEFSALAA